MSLILGIDPGQTGAIAALDHHGEIIEIHDMPLVAGGVSASLLSDLICDLAKMSWETTAVVEQVHSMPKQGVASSFKFGMSYGIILGTLGGHAIRVEHAQPGKWKRAIGVTADKETSRRKAIERWPAQAALFARKKDNESAEAALIALYWIEAQR